MRVGAERFMKVFNDIVMERGFKKADSYPYPMRAFPSFFKINEVIYCSVMYEPKQFSLAFYINENEHEAFGEGLYRSDLHKIITDKPKGNYNDIADLVQECNSVLDDIIKTYETDVKAVLVNTVRYQLKKNKRTNIFYNSDSLDLISTLPLDITEFEELYTKTGNDRFLPKDVRDLFIF